MSCNKAYRLILMVALAGSLTAVSGCRNPFLPNADIQITEITFPGISSDTTELPVFRNPAMSPAVYFSYRVNFNFLLLNKVGVDITSVNMFFTDMAGNPVTVYAATGGKTIKLMSRMSPPTTNSPDGVNRPIEFIVMDSKVFAALDDPTLKPPTQPNVIICTMTFRGVDDNGYDVKLSAQFTIKGYGL